MTQSTPLVSSPDRLEALTGLRFLAAFHVLLFHSPAVYMQFPDWLRNIVASGHTAVSLFFVLSGFVLAYAYLRDGQLRTSKKEFWWYRFARVYPAYILSVVLFTPRVFMRPPVIESHDIAPTFLVTILGLQSWVELLEWNLPAWSLSVEAFFYLVFPWVAIYIGRIASRGKLLTFAAATWLLSLILPTLATLRPDLIDGDVVRHLPLIRLPEFVIGIVTGVYYVRFRNDIPSWALPVGGIGYLVVLAFRPELPRLLLHNSLTAPLISLLILGLASTTGPVVRLLSSAPMVTLGEASYGIYILQSPLHMLWKGLILGTGKAMSIPTDVWLESVWFHVGFYIFISAVCILLERRFDRPARRWLIGLQK
jgi:peptidoglycan/LPS O-acetylase OafA/YrhL